MFKNLKKRAEGFTIIEVLIVLAIAGLIMLIVFLAVPALQRNQRNTARTSDASRWATSVTECLANRNNKPASCSAAASLNVGVLSQLTGFGAASVTGVLLQFGGAGTNGGCLPDGSGTAPGVNATSFSISYMLEPAIPRCISG
jgi:prepilin-type N-terminal cleavage/methylation domain-containing protein